MAFDRVIGSTFFAATAVGFSLQDWGFIHPLQFFKQAKETNLVEQ
jgi:hypothetical protein